jgi:hypothetical protein
MGTYALLTGKRGSGGIIMGEEKVVKAGMTVNPVRFPASAILNS